MVIRGIRTVLFVALMASLLGLPPAQSAERPAAPARPATGSLTVKPAAATVGSRLTIRGRVPATSPRRVRLQREVSGTWLSIDERRTNAQGRFRFRTQAPADGTRTTYRVKATPVRQGGHRLEAVTTRARAVAIRPATSPVQFTFGKGVEITSARDLRKIAAAPASFRDFIRRLATEDTDDECDNPQSIGVTRVRTDGFAEGSVFACGGYRAMWGIVDGAWQEISGTQDTWPCGDLKRYAVPTSFQSECYDYDQTPTPGWSSKIDFTHPSWGPSVLYTYPGPDGARIEVHDRYGLAWFGSFAFEGTYELRANTPATDATGNLFVDYNPGRYDGVIVLQPKPGGFVSSSLLSQVPPLNYYYAETRDVDGDGVLEIAQSSNDCVPSCAGGTTTTKILHWDGSTYVAR